MHTHGTHTNTHLVPGLNAWLARETEAHRAERFATYNRWWSWWNLETKALIDFTRTRCAVRLHHTNVMGKLWLLSSSKAATKLTMKLAPVLPTNTWNHKLKVLQL